MMRNCPQAQHRNPNIRHRRMSLADTFPMRKIDAVFCLILLLLSMLIQQGRIGASVNGVDLTTDPANYACMAAAKAHPEAFQKDAAFADAEKYGVHATSTTPLVSALAEDGNYGVAYLKLTGVHVFLHYLTFYILGIVLLKKRWQALLFTLLMGQVYWILWGTYWGNGYPDYSPRSTFAAIYPLYIVAALAILHRPRWWPAFMAAIGLMVYVHSISTLPIALGFWLGFALHRPAQWSRIRHFLWLIFSGLCFLAAIGPFVLTFLRPGVALSPEDVELLRLVLWTRYDPEFTNYWQGIGRFFLHHIMLPIFPLGVAGAWVMRRYGNEEEKELAGQFGMWTLGVLTVAALFVVDHEVARRLNRHPYQFDLIRVLRFLVFFAQILSFLGINVLLRIIPREKIWGRRLAGFAWFGLFVGLFFGGQQDQARLSLLWYWNSLNPARYEQAYAPLLQRDAMIEAIKKHTEPGASIFYAKEEQALRYRALRSLTYSWKDASIYYYAKDTKALRRWEDMREELQSSPTAYMHVGVRSGADYLLSDRPQDKAALEKLGAIVWENTRYVLVRLKQAGTTAAHGIPRQ